MTWWRPKYAVRIHVGNTYVERGRYFTRRGAESTACRMNGWPTFGFQWVVEVLA